jgi:hypothetical protein
VYMMYYTDNADVGVEFQSCGYLCNTEQTRAYPADSIQPLPRNPLLEAYAIHGKMNHQLRTNSTTSEEMSITEQTIHRHEDEEIEHNSQHDSNSMVLVDDETHHQQHLEMEKQPTTEAAAAIPVKQATKEVHVEKVNTISSKSDNQKQEDNFWSILFFFRRFF